MNLFESGNREIRESQSPLASRMRPTSLDEFVGQAHIVGDGRLLRRAISADRVSSMILYGPPGTGKTTLARIIANSTSSHFEQLNAVTAGVADIRRVIADAEERMNLFQVRTILFIDEIHRFNKSQQDALLPAVEDGRLILIGATTENPYFEVNSPLISRSRIFKLEALNDSDIKLLLNRALQDRQRGLGAYNAYVDDEAMDHIVTISSGDARTALNALELAVLTTPPGEDGKRLITLAVAEESIQKRALRYDKGGDNHYDTISAFIKAMRGSDPDAAVYWLAKMIYAGEDPKFIARRLIVHAAEDVGAADPMALMVAHAAAHAVEFVGLPEARIPLAEAAIYIACAPKSNACCAAINAAMDRVAKGEDVGIPAHLRDSSYKSAGKLGHGVGYLYPHSFPGNFVKQNYLPPSLEGVKFYRPTQNGLEATISRRLADLWNSPQGDSGSGDDSK